MKLRPGIFSFLLPLFAFSAFSQTTNSFPPSGNVGIGTLTPALNLEIQGSAAPGIIINDTDGGGDRPLIRFKGNDILVLDSDDSNAKVFGFYSQFGQTRNNDALLRVFGRSGNWGRYIELTHDGTNGLISTDAGHIILNPASGNVAIGTTDPKGYKLAVAGNIISEEIVVKLQGNWPDYVFEEDYDLPSLSQVAAYIKQNKHLPEMPSAKEVEQNGVNVGEMNTLLLKKLEELTLYVIELKEENERQQREIERLKKRK